MVILDQTPIFEWFMSRLVVKNRHHKDMYQGEIGLYAQLRDHSKVDMC